MRLGIFGGTFDPVHRGHLAVAEAAKKGHGLDRVFLMPAGRPPHKTRELASPADRLAMVRLAVKGWEGLEASDLEVRRSGVTYTVDTLEELTRRYPESELFFIVGSDSLAELRSWRQLGRILELARLVVVNRSGSAVVFPRREFPGIAQERLRRCAEDAVAMDPVPVSSTAVRQAVRLEEPLDGLVPAAVARYIKDRGLYR